MMTDKQLKALMYYTVCIAAAAKDHRLHGKSAENARDELYAAFGFVKGEDSWPAVPQRRHDQHCNCVGCATYRDAEAATARQQAGNPIREGNLDAWPSVIVGFDPAKPGADTTAFGLLEEEWPQYPEKTRRIAELLRFTKTCHGSYPQTAEDIIGLWDALKEIMEPASDICRGCGCKRGEVHTAKGPSARGTCARVQLEWDGEL